MKLDYVRDAHMAESHDLRHGLLQVLPLRCNRLAVESDMEVVMTMEEGGQKHGSAAAVYLDLCPREDNAVAMSLLYWLHEHMPTLHCISSS